MTKDTLQKELETYKANRSELLKKSKGKFVLIHGEEIVGVYDTHETAVRIGYETLGNVPFLIKEIVEVEMPLNFTSNMLGI